MSVWWALAAGAVLVLTACSLPAAEAVIADLSPASVATLAPAPGEAEGGIALDGEGLRLIAPSGRTTLLAFGILRPMVEQAVAKLLDDEPVLTANAECGAGPMSFARYGALTLNFQDASFVGWTLDRPGDLTTMDGIGAGTSRADLAGRRTIEMIPGSTLGEEFMVTNGGIGGFLDGPGEMAKVTGLYSGTTCFFR